MDAEIYAKVIVQRFGGHKRFFELHERRHETVLRAWEQDSDRIGRVIRAHLFVEHFLGEFLQSQCLGLASLRCARLSFSQKASLLPETHPTLSPLGPGIKRLNAIRNRIAHTLRADILEEDSNVFKGIAIFVAMQKAGGNASCLSAEPLAVLEIFAKFTGMTLAAAATPDAVLWSAEITKEELKLAQSDQQGLE